MQITEQVIITIITAFCAPALLAVIGIVAVRSKNQAVAQRERVEAENRRLKADAARIEAEAEMVKKEAEGKLLREQSDASQMQQVMQMFQQQITINRQYRQLLGESRKSNESNYRTLVSTQNDNTQMLLTEIQTKSRLLSEKIDEIPAKIQNANTAAVSEFAKLLGAEVAIVIAEQFTRQKVESNLYPFPDVDDPSWHDDTVTPIVPDVTIFREPRLWDDAKLQKPCAKIAAGGEKARIITGRMPRWIAIYKFEAGERCWGWLPEFAVKVGQPEIFPA